MNTNPIKHIVIVGGGSAGWISAGLIAAKYQACSPAAMQISLIESPDVATIGVGEGTWPSMRNTLRQIGISETDFINNCDASFKQGSKFVGWANGHADDHYYHPFTSPPGYGESNLYQAWQHGAADLSFADAVSVQSHVCEAGCAPKQFATPDFAGVTNYGYHLDAAKFAALLQQHCVAKLGVKHIVDHVTHIIAAENGDIAAVATKQNGLVQGDLFIDCSGVKSLLLGEHFAIPFIDKQHILFNDSALAMHLPYADAEAPISSATIASAQDGGWLWDIGLQSRRGVGYVYSSAHLDEAQAQASLLAYGASVLGKHRADDLRPRKISFRPGHRQKFWHRNCVAIGMSAGFLEPLEASALALVELSCTMLCDEMPLNRAHMDIISARFNARFSYRWQRTIEFLKLHYVLSQRRDSDYWRDNQAAASIPDRLAELLNLWQYQSPSRYDFIQNEEVFSSASYQYVLYGMGFKTLPGLFGQDLKDDGVSKKLLQANIINKDKYVSGLPSNRALLQHFARRPHSLASGISQGIG